MNELPRVWTEYDLDGLTTGEEYHDTEMAQLAIREGATAVMTHTIYGISLLDGPDVTEDNNYMWFTSTEIRDERAIEYLNKGYSITYHKPYQSSGIETGRNETVQTKEGI